MHMPMSRHSPVPSQTQLGASQRSRPLAEHCPVSHTGGANLRLC